MGRSVILLTVVFFLHFLAFILAITALGRDQVASVILDELDGRTFCSYESDLSTAYGLAAFGVILLSQLVIMVATRCLCCGKGLAGGEISLSCAILPSVFSWLTFVITEALLLTGSAKNAYHTKYMGQYVELDAGTCKALRKGEFAMGAVFVILSLMLSFWLFWVHSRAATTGSYWQRQMKVEQTSHHHHDDGNSTV